ncbi:unnamed protein product, partial [Soboliphyme baturini]|uniref:Carboxylic ester hydrolase n=1 Tax=Soboliphyme baturini TaxID=241478 RepID=A0A183IJ73_9BILA
ISNFIFIFHRPSPFGSRGFQTCKRTAKSNFNVKLNEDCLSVNVWAPAEKKNLPVMVCIFGGGFLSGNPSTDYYDGEVLAIHSDVVVVSVNYRLGPFGFLNLDDDEVPSNLGLLDQQLALRWVYRNVQFFGGDPHNVTIFGNSAGAVFVSAHMLAKDSWKYFHRAIIQSGGIIAPWAHTSVSKAREASLKLAEYVGCSKGTTEERMLESLDVIFPDLPMLIKKSIASHFLPQELKMYSADTTVLSDFPYIYRDILAKIVGDFLFKCSVTKTAEIVPQQHEEAAVFVYHFAERSSSIKLPAWMGTTHGHEIQHVFGGPLRHSNVYTEQEKEFSKLIINLWTSFAATG